MENLESKTKNIMKKYGISAQKSLGQNFLIREDVVEDIVKASDITKEDLVIEIGPGLGTLTEELLDKAGEVIAIELDNRMVNILNSRFVLCKNLKIINEDVLKINLERIIQEEKSEKKFKNAKIVANLPYYITTPIIMKLLEDKLDVTSITVMIQKEVADRLVAQPGSKMCGAITYSVHYYSEPQSIRLVEKESFIPQPEVTSEVIKLNIRKSPLIKTNNEELLFKIIKTSFMQRRKTLINALVNGKIIENKMHAMEILQKLGMDSNVRGEKLSLQDYSNLCNEISNSNHL